MRYIVLGDIHGNLEALTAVLADAGEAGFDRVLCVGDIVGYGANPKECIEVVRDCDALVVAGNHDWAVLDKVSIDYFNADARDSIEWTREQLSAADLEYLDAAKLIEVVQEVTLVHSSPFSPEYFDYLQTLYDVQLAFDHLATRLCFVGHSHWPVMFLNTTPVDYFLREEFELPPDRRAVVNVGSVGQPRDSDPRACYFIYESEQQTIYLRRVDYDLHPASEKILAAGLPATNARRIVLGR